MSKPFIAVIDYGIGNLRSAEKGLCQVGADARLVSCPRDIATADGVVLPGVGNFGRCSQALSESGLWPAALEATRSGQPFLGICVGMQLLYEGSAESPGVPGLSVCKGTVSLLPDGVRRPQMQWNRLDVAHGSRLLGGFEQNAWVYFVHSYAPPIGEETAATCDYGGPVAAAVEMGPVWATQFHPEKSSAVGLGVLANFVTVCK
jgi:imidazole glycerol-phosphate synthase subunit HisH